jgi:hypothetical protein
METRDDLTGTARRMWLWVVAILDDNDRRDSRLRGPCVGVFKQASR